MFLFTMCFNCYVIFYMGFTRWLSGKESTCQCRRCRRCQFNPWVRKIPWRRKWQPTPVFLPEKLHGPKSLGGYSPWSHRESDMTEQMSKFINLSATSNFLLSLYIPSIHFIHCIFHFQNFHLACFGVYTHTHL